MLGREVVERREVVPVAVQRLDGPVLATILEPPGELVRRAWHATLVGADQTSRSRRQASGQSRFGSLSTRLSVRWFQHRWRRVDE